MEILKGILQDTTSLRKHIVEVIQYTHDYFSLVSKVEARYRLFYSA